MSYRAGQLADATGKARVPRDVVDAMPLHPDVARIVPQPLDELLSGPDRHVATVSCWGVTCEA